jgi:hypothetical protein
VARAYGVLTTTGAPSGLRKAKESLAWLDPVVSSIALRSSFSPSCLAPDADVGSHGVR